MVHSALAAIYQIIGNLEDPGCKRSWETRYFRVAYREDGQEMIERYLFRDGVSAYFISS